MGQGLDEQEQGWLSELACDRKLLEYGITKEQFMKVLYELNETETVNDDGTSVYSSSELMQM